MVQFSSKLEVFEFSGEVSLHVTCDAHFQTRTRDDVCEHVREIS